MEIITLHVRTCWDDDGKIDIGNIVRKRAIIIKNTNHKIYHNKMDVFTEFVYVADPEQISFFVMINNY